MRLIGGAFCILWAACLVACGGQSSDDSGDSSGGGNAGNPSEAQGGDGATTGPEGGAGASSEGPLPACLTSLFASCELKGACTVEDVNQDGTQLRYCFPSGVELSSSKGTECHNREDKIYASDGSLCYSRSVLAYAGHACEDPTLTWADGAGNEIAKATWSGGTRTQISCAAGGEEASCAADESCGWDAPNPLNCSPGVCP